mgnify:CR=1 FL=1
MSTLAALALSFALGVFYVLSVLERPIWPLMLDPNAARVLDSEARALHAILNRVIHILPPTMLATMLTAVTALIAQMWQRSCDPWSIAALLVLVVQLARLAVILPVRIAAVKQRPIDAPALALRKSTGELAAAHHAGLLMAGSTLLVQLVILASPAP